MIMNQQSTWKRHGPQGISVMIVAVAMIFILGMAGLAIDLASLYVGRSQAQRAADAAALAGAFAWTNDPTCISGNGSTITAACQSLAMQQAEAIGNQNLIAGVSPNIQDSDVTFDLSDPNDPRITVVAARDTSRGNPMPTFFIKIFGVDTANVSAQATAEAFNPSGTGIPIGVSCVKPWFFPNCDEYAPADSGNSGNCAQNSNGTYPGAFVAGSMAGGDLTVSRPDSYPTGAYGEPITMKPGSPGSAAAPGQYDIAYIPNTATAPTMCPACATTGSVTGGTGSAAVYRMNIECCNETPVVCGPVTVTIDSTPGNKVGPTNQGVDCLIQQSPGCGQDYLQGVSPTCAPTSDPPKTNEIPNYPFVIKPGANDTYAQGASSIPMSNSNSVVAVPIYQGILQSGQNTVNVIGFMKIFLKYDDSANQGTVYGYVLDVTACGGGAGTGTGGGSGVISSGGSTTPVRLIRSGS